MLIRRVSILTVAMVALGSTIALAKPTLLSRQVIAQTPTIPHPNPGKSVGWLKDLNLTSQQLQQIKEIRNQSKQQIAQKSQEIRQGQQELHDLIVGTATKEQVRGKYNQIKLVKQQLADMQFENTLAIREILNPEQRQKFADRMYKKNPPARQN
ncbi:MAG: Spy/CpxP family protein refolding chaperone [Nostoc sp. DedVER02]|uniref:Spy/CpxP family protein refolding chaperone n=1 Tax=unclassified Nostoc TaxID=2593658 RepID=UPI002AD3926B|nr:MULTISPECIES: Spy/CpxP family protein refolding chaperone [unclassified Nostoc]MDZ7987367.1 Spy/CpxP family protein refolding chaperone [Nostoc sp. DedVER02]MDZ8116035.1 Spy/CpxP family protein refolding chaperone [Nostoc sp. DedVER01b]